MAVRRGDVQKSILEKVLPSVAFHSRQSVREVPKLVKNTYQNKLLALSEQQDRPLFNVKNTVTLHDLDEVPPVYVMETLSFGPKNAELERFNRHDILAEVDYLLNHCKESNLSEDLISDINIKTIAYIKECKKQKF